MFQIPFNFEIYCSHILTLKQIFFFEFEFIFYFLQALERNMSLSGQYLEELSRRYKRQVEEMQKALVAAVEERKRGEEREERTGEQLVQLSEKVASLTIAVENLLNERDSWQHKVSIGRIQIIEELYF